MCIMEVRPGQRTSTIAQACAHNVSTVERDLDMFEPLLAARAQHSGSKAEAEALDSVRQAHEHLRRAYAGLLTVFAGEVASEVTSGHDHDHGDHGSERTLAEQAHHDAGLARRYETR